MPDKVAFATSNWKDKPDKPDSMTQAEWDAYNSSEFNGFPFPIIEDLNENGEPIGFAPIITNNFQREVFSSFEKTYPHGEKINIPSERSDRLVTVLGYHYSYPFTKEQLFELFWRMKSAKTKVTFNQPVSDQFIETTSSEHRSRTHYYYIPTVFNSSNFDDCSIDFTCEAVQASFEEYPFGPSLKDEETKLVTELNTNYWAFYVNVEAICDCRQTTPCSYDDYYYYYYYYE
jgi:hypothetical protein